MHWIDVTVPLRAGMPAYPGDPPVAVERIASRAHGDEYDLTRLSLGAHAGTHVDAPAHFIEGGATIEALALDVLCGAAYVVDLRGHRRIDAAALRAAGVPAGCERLVLKTANSLLWDEPEFVSDYAALTADGARWLVDRGVRLVGIDYVSIAPFDDPATVHRALLSVGVVIVEGLDLREAEAGECTLFCLPLLVPGADGAPARVVLGRAEP